jgi:hypothetical protein
MTIGVILRAFLGGRDLVAEPGVELGEGLGISFSTRNFSSRGTAGSNVG